MTDDTSVKSAVTIDIQGGLVEYWTGYGEPAANVAFKSKLDTDLFEFAKNKTRPLNLTVAPGGKFLAAFSADKKVSFQIIYFVFCNLLMKEWDKRVTLFQRLKFC